MFDINTTAVRATSRALLEGSYELNRCAGEIGEVKSLLSGLSSMGPILGALDTLQLNVRTESRNEEDLYDEAQRISRMYEDCEEDIISNTDEDKFDIRFPAYGTSNFSLGQSSGRSGVDTRTLGELLELFK